MKTNKTNHYTLLPILLYIRINTGAEHNLTLEVVEEWEWAFQLAEMVLVSATPAQEAWELWGLIA